MAERSIQHFRRALNTHTPPACVPLEPAAATAARVGAVRVRACACCCTVVRRANRRQPPSQLYPHPPAGCGCSWEGWGQRGRTYPCLWRVSRSVSPSIARRVVAATAAAMGVHTWRACRYPACRGPACRDPPAAIPSAAMPPAAIPPASAPVCRNPAYIPGPPAAITPTAIPPVVIRMSRSRLPQSRLPRSRLRQSRLLRSCPSRCRQRAGGPDPTLILTAQMLPVLILLAQVLLALILPAQMSPSLFPPEPHPYAIWRRAGDGAGVGGSVSSANVTFLSIRDLRPRPRARPGQPQLAPTGTLHQALSRRCFVEIPSRNGANTPEIERGRN